MQRTKKRQFGFKVADDLRIGQPFGSSRTKDGDRPIIKRLAELCNENREPHVHVVTSEGHYCLGFNQPVN